MKAPTLHQSRKVRVSIVLACNSVCSIRCFGDFAASFDLSLPLIDCPCIPHILIYVTTGSLHLHKIIKRASSRRLFKMHLQSKTMYKRLLLHLLLPLLLLSLLRILLIKSINKPQVHKRHLRLLQVSFLHHCIYVFSRRVFLLCCTLT